MALPTKQDLIAEKRDLDDRLDRLRLFMVSADAADLEQHEKRRIGSQAGLMLELSTVLGARIAAMGGIETAEPPELSDEALAMFKSGQPDDYDPRVIDATGPLEP